jgi:hypothetical protein
LKFNGAIQTRESGKLFVPPQFSQSPRERQENQELISILSVGVQHLSNKHLWTGMDGSWRYPGARHLDRAVRSGRAPVETTTPRNCSLVYWLLPRSE